MTVAELIAHLQTFPQDMTVVRHSYNSDYVETDSLGIRKITVIAETHPGDEVRLSDYYRTFRPTMHRTTLEVVTIGGR